MRLGSVSLPGLVGLAPMAGVADRAMRTLCKSFGASYVVGEMVSSKGMLYGDRKSASLMEITPDERPMAVQLFGSDPAQMAESARLALRFSPDIIDINMGCPAPKIVASGGGSALMRSPRLAGDIVRAVSQAVDLPVTVKFRKGWDDAQVNAVEFAQICAENGAAALTVHGRTREQMYAGECDLSIIRDVVNAVSIPVLGNGDVSDGPSAKRMLDETGCAMLLLGRGALGSPWVFAQISAFLCGAAPPPNPPLAEVLQILMRHATLAIAHKGEHRAMLEMRKHAAWYMKGWSGAAALRREAGLLCTFDDLQRLCQKAYE